jgi:hypothetical protein
MKTDEFKNKAQKYIGHRYTTSLSIEFKADFIHEGFRIWYPRSVYPALWCRDRLNVCLNEEGIIKDVYMG